MMLSVDTVHGLKIIIIALLSYIPTVSIAGWFEAWIAKKCDDELPEELGYLTLHPMAHFNLIGFCVLLIGQLFGAYVPFFKDFPGWGRYIPLNPSTLNIKKTILEFSARGIAHMIMMLAGFFMIVIMVKTNLLQFSATQDFISTNSAFANSLFSVLMFFYYQNFVLCVIYLVIAIFRILLFTYFPQMHLFSSRNMIFAFVLLVATIMIGSTILNYLLTLLMKCLGRIFLF